MKLALHGFSETMRGTWTPNDGSGRRVLWFSIDADATDALAYLKDGRMQVDGVMFAEGLGENVPATGHIEVQPMRGRVGYRLSFEGHDGKTYRLTGDKTYSWLRPVYGATVLPAEVTDEFGAVIGTSLTRFDARHDLVGFVRSFRAARVERHQLRPRTA